MATITQNFALATGSLGQDKKCLIWKDSSSTESSGRREPCVLGGISLEGSFHLIELGRKRVRVGLGSNTTDSLFLPSFSRFSLINVSLFAVCTLTISRDFKCGAPQVLSCWNETVLQNL